jgi:hypothetical protein
MSTRKSSTLNPKVKTTTRDKIWDKDDKLFHPILLPTGYVQLQVLQSKWPSSPWKLTWENVILKTYQAEVLTTAKLVGY